MRPQAIHPTSLRGLASSLWKNRQLILQLSKREVVGRYRGSIMGLAWSFFNQLLMLVVYTFVYSMVFKDRWGIDGGESKVDFAVILFVGMLVHGLFAECVNRAPGLILANVSYVKKVVFPLEVLPWVAMASALFHSLVGLIVLIGTMLVFKLSIPWTAILLPLIILPLLLATIGVAWFLAATGVFLRDVSQTTGVITTVMLFLAPVLYQKLMFVNPLTFIIEQSRAVLFWGQLPNWLGLTFYFVTSALIAWMGFWWFQKTRNGFADVL